MKRLLVVTLAAVASFAIVQADYADAARIGGGRSFGMQRSIVPPAARTTPPAANTFSGPAANPVMPAAPAATAARAAPGAGAASSASGMSRWLGPIAGLAAGLGLAALFAHLGLSEGLGSLLLVGLLAVGAVVLVRALLARRARPTPYQYAGAPGATLETRREPALDAAWGSPRPAAPPAGNYPPGFDPAPFLAQAKQQFRRLQAAYDRGDRRLLDDVTTPDMRAEIARDLATRGAHVATEVIALEADLLEVVEEDDRYVASVRFGGTLREGGAAAPQPFEEMWHLVKPVDGSSGWLLAGIQQYA